jgi:fermentation-respiration switch protein FrsA (DUF1100 family)
MELDQPIGFEQEVLPEQPRQARAVKNALMRIARSAALIYLGLLFIAMFFEEKLIFFPAQYPQGDWEPAGLDFENVEFLAADGVRLHGWYCPVTSPRSVVLMSHGNAGNITHRADEILLWQKHLNVSVFIYDYRGYGRSAGKPNERGVNADARGAYDWLAGQKGIAPEDIVLRGESIGGAVSLVLALAVPHRGLIMESPFTSAVEMGQRAMPWIPVRWLMRNRFDSIEKVAQYHGPLLITHGTRDSIVPFEMGERLFERANEPKRFYAVKGADHNDVPWVGGTAYFGAIDEFLSLTENSRTP